jgi:hypothetical protein
MRIATSCLIEILCSKEPFMFIGIGEEGAIDYLISVVLLLLLLAHT